MREEVLACHTRTYSRRWTQRPAEDRLLQWLSAAGRRIWRNRTRKWRPPAASQ